MYIINFEYSKFRTSQLIFNNNVIVTYCQMVGEVD